MYSGRNNVLCLFVILLTTNVRHLLTSDVIAPRSGKCQHIQRVVYTQNGTVLLMAEENSQRCRERCQRYWWLGMHKWYRAFQSIDGLGARLEVEPHLKTVVLPLMLQTSRMHIKKMVFFKNIMPSFSCSACYGLLHSYGHDIIGLYG